MREIKVNGTVFTMSDRSYDLTMEGAQMRWDSESRKSPYSTVADPEDEFCEDCEAALATTGEDHCDECYEYLKKHGAL